MALSLRNNKRAGHVGLDIDDGFLAAAEISNGVLSRTVSTALPTGLSSEGEVTDSHGLGESIKEFFRRQGLPRSVRLGVANQQIVVRQVEIPLVDNDRDRDAAVRFQAAEAVPMPLDDAILDYQLIERVSVDGSERERMVVVAARKSMIDRLLDASRSAGLKVEGIDLNAFALVRTLTTSEVDAGSQVENARVYCHLGGMTNLAIAVGSTCVFTRPLTTSRDADDAEIAASLAEDIRLSIDFHLNLPGARTVADVVLSGPGAEREGLLYALDGLIDRPVTVAQPLGTLPAYTMPPDEDPHRYTVAAGLALGAAA